jgi:hypothetical protein
VSAIGDDDPPDLLATEQAQAVAGLPCTDPEANRRR